MKRGEPAAIHSAAAGPIRRTFFNDADARSAWDRGPALASDA